MRFAFIAAHLGVWPVAWQCSALGVSRSGFHAGLNCPRSLLALRAPQDRKADARQALRARPRRRGRPQAVLHHSDRGSRYSSEQFQRLLAELGVTCSMSRSGNVWENAAMESFFSSLKTARIRGRIHRSRHQARADVFDYIERFYDPRRGQSSVGYLSPMDFAALAEAG